MNEFKAWKAGEDVEEKLLWGLYIKSHTEAPDYEREIAAWTKEEAVELAYTELKGEFDRSFIESHMDLLS